MTQKERIDILTTALKRIRLSRPNHCEHYWPDYASCRTDPQRRPTARYTAVRWCDSCIAHDALEKAAK